MAAATTTTTAATTTTTNTTTGTTTNTTTTTSTSTTTTSTTSTTTTTTTTTTIDPNTTTTQSSTTTTSTTSTTTTQEKCYKPYDPHGNYTALPFNAIDNSTWVLECDPGYISNNALYLAICQGKGVLRPAGKCALPICDTSEVRRLASETTCNNSAKEGETCTVVCEKGNDIVGAWTCLRTKMHGHRPACIDYEKKYWTVAWVRPKIIGSFDFFADVARYTNVSNSTIGARETDSFRQNISKALADCLVGVNPSHFDVFNVYHLYEDPNLLMKGWEEGSRWRDQNNDPTLWKVHLLRVEYEWIAWDVNTLDANEERLLIINEKESDVQLAFKQNLWDSTEWWMSRLFPVVIPFTFNETFVAPDSGVVMSGAQTDGPHIILWLLVATTLMPVIVSIGGPDKLARAEYGSLYSASKE